MWYVPSAGKDLVQWFGRRTCLGSRQNTHACQTKAISPALKAGLKNILQAQSERNCDTITIAIGTCLFPCFVHVY